MVDDLKKSRKKENLPEDMVKDTQDKIQKLTDKYVGIIDTLVSEKEKEFLPYNGFKKISNRGLLLDLHLFCNYTRNWNLAYSFSFNCCILCFKRVLQ